MLFALSSFHSVKPHRVHSSLLLLLLLYLVSNIENYFKKLCNLKTREKEREKKLQLVKHTSECEIVNVVNINMPLRIGTLLLCMKFSTSFWNEWVKKTVWFSFIQKNIADRICSLLLFGVFRCRFISHTQRHEHKTSTLQHNNSNS